MKALLRRVKSKHLCSSIYRSHLLFGASFILNFVDRGKKGRCVWVVGTVGMCLGREEEEGHMPCRVAGALVLWAWPRLARSPGRNHGCSHAYWALGLEGFALEFFFFLFSGWTCRLKKTYVHTCTTKAKTMIFSRFFANSKRNILVYKEDRNTRSRWTKFQEFP